MNDNLRSALVVEGGGMRGVFSAGVLDCFLEHDFDPFDLYLGVSAGACNLASHLGRQHGRNLRCYTEHMLSPEFFSLKKYLRGGHYMDLDWFWEHLARVEPLNAKGASVKDFYIGVTNIATGQPEYIRAHEQTLFETLKASSALPLMYRTTVKLDGSDCMDGGLTDPIPVKEAWQRGARRILVLRSQLAGYRKKSFFETNCAPLFFRKYPLIRKALREREARYSQTLDFMKNPPSSLRLIEVCPTILHSKRTTRDRGCLLFDYEEGKRTGLRIIEKWNESD